VTEADLTNPETQPNPLIKKLIDIGHELHGLSMESKSQDVVLYGIANRHILSAIENLFAVKKPAGRRGSMKRQKLTMADHIAIESEIATIKAALERIGDMVSGKVPAKILDYFVSWSPIDKALFRITEDLGKERRRWYPEVSEY
jgi:hypothetical protein